MLLQLSIKIGTNLICQPAMKWASFLYHKMIGFTDRPFFMSITALATSSGYWASTQAVW